MQCQACKFARECVIGAALLVENHLASSVGITRVLHSYMRTKFARIALLLALFGAAGKNAEAALVKIGSATYNGARYNLIWDDETPSGEVVWLDYTNHGLNWEQQSNWSYSLMDGMTYEWNPGVTVQWQGDWRLPVGSIDVAPNQTDFGHLIGMEL
jgi:hypothetical protein